MSELSLTKLAEERSGTWIASLTCRMIYPRTSDTQLEAIGLKDLRELGGVVYGLPEHVAENETFLNVRLGRRVPPREDRENESSDLEEWMLTWGQITPELAKTVPELVVAESAAFGGSAGLEARVRKHLETLTDEDEDPSDVLVTVEYALTGWKSKLLASKSRKFGQLEAMPSAAYWNVLGADVLFGVSLRARIEGLPRYRDEETNLTAFARVHGGPQDAGTIERQVWQDVLQLLEPSI